MTEQQMRAWIKRLLEINNAVKSTQEQAAKIQMYNRLCGYIESLENIDI